MLDKLEITRYTIYSAIIALGVYFFRGSLKYKEEREMDMPALTYYCYRDRWKRTGYESCLHVIPAKTHLW